jgi:thiol-disulfide isomerase/thioredoxin
MTTLLALAAVAACLADDPKKQTAPPATPKMVPAIPMMVKGALPPEADRPGEVKKAWEAYQSTCVRFADALARAGTADEKAELAKRAPTPVGLALRLARVAAADPKDDAGFDALALLAEYADVPAVTGVLSAPPPAKFGDKPGKPLDPLALVLEHHLNNPKLADVCEKLPAGPTADKFLAAVFEKSVSQQARGKAGYKIASAAKDGESEAAERVLAALADDRYMDGVRVGVRGATIREWAAGELLERRTLAVGKPIPEVRAEGLDGKTRAVTDHKGKVVVLDIWATWCGPCRAMIPHQREMVKKLEGKPFALVSVSCDEEKDTLKEFLQDTAMPWEHWWAGRNGELSKALNIRFYPTIYVVDAKGVIRYKNIRGEKLDEAVEKLLAEAK